MEACMRLQIQQPRIKNVFVLIAAFVLTPFAWVVLFSDADLSESSVMERRLAELRDRLHHAESLNRERVGDIHTLRNQIRLLIGTHEHSNGSLDLFNQTQLPESWYLQMIVKQDAQFARLLNARNGSNSTSPLEGLHGYDSLNSSSGSLRLPKETQELLANMSLGSSDISPPGMFNYLPHLVGKPEGLQPAYKLSQGRTGVSVVIGVPTIKRERESYLVKTLQSLIDSLNDEEKKDCLILVFVAEPNDLQFVKELGTDIQARFQESLQMGLLEVISPSHLFYPDMNNLRATFGDPMERVKWRTKQNLDFAFLMMYARSRGTYYVQLEDDVVTKPGYLSSMKNFALNQKTDDWLLLEFSYLGFIGKMFKSRDLPTVVEFFLMFYKDKPIDWLLDHLLFVKVCNPEKDHKHCQRSIGELRRRFKPSLFQHIGTHSSLKGKVQKLKDKDFGRGGGQVVRAHLNPTAEVSSTLKIYQHYSLDRAYMGETFFWSTIPHPGDVLLFKFNPVIQIHKYLFRSGNPEHPGDRFYNTTVEVLPHGHIDKEAGVLDNKAHHHGYQRTPEGFLVIGRFDDTTGIATGTVEPALGPIDTLRLHIQSQSESWVILSEISIEPQR